MLSACAINNNHSLHVVYVAKRVAVCGLSLCVSVCVCV